MSEPLQVKIVLVGPSGSGAKSSLILRYVDDTFDESISSTIGARFYSKVVEVDGVTVKQDIWDTAGQQRYRSLAPLYYRGAGIGIVGFDVTSESSLEECDYWIKALRDEKVCVIVAVGNKIDAADRREVTPQQAREYFESMDPPIPYFEISAKTGQNVKELFDAATRLWLQKTALSEMNGNENVKDEKHS